VVYSLGSNLGDRLNNLQGAVDALRDTPDVIVVDVSSVYETDPVDSPEGSPPYLNAVVELATKKEQIEGDIKRLNDMRLAAYGSGVGTGSLKPVACPSTYDGSIGSKAAQAACSQIGKSYVFNTSGPKTFDCSGLTMYAWSQAGVKTLRHYTKWQYQDTKRVTRDQLRPGDLVFFYGDMHHMGMYVGNGWMVHAPHSGDVVRMKEISSMPASGYGRPA